MTEGAVVSLSGGMDSCTALAWAIKRWGIDNVMTIAFYYGQKHFKELELASEIAAFYHVPHERITMPQVFSGAGSTLVDADASPQMMDSYEELAKKFGGQPTVVPNRNMNFIALAISYAWTHEKQHVVLGVHAGDAGNFHYPDCRPAFVGAMNAACEIATEGRVDIIAPFNHDPKSHLVKVAYALGAPLQLTQSCYNGQRPACGKCATCHERLNAFAEAGFEDPIAYVDGVNANGERQWFVI